MKKNIITLKIGGALAKKEELILDLAEDMKECGKDDAFIIIHGGGAEVTELTRKFGIEPVFEKGIRITTKEEMQFVDKVLSGKVNKRLVRLFQTCGFNAVGLSGSDGRLFTGESLGECNNCLTHTGRILKVNTHLLNLLLTENYLPIIASTSMDETGMPLNINADEVAFEVSSGIQISADTQVSAGIQMSSETHVSALIFFSDIPGILKGEKILHRLRPEDIKREVDAKTITGGMIPKTKASIDALNKGVGRIIIGDFTGRGSLRSLLKEEKGTHITL